MRMLIPFVLALLAVAPTGSQGIVGDWQGVLKAGPQELRVVLHLTGDTASGLAATFDSVDQGAMGLPVVNIALTGSTLRFTLPQVGGSFEGMLDEARTAVRGTWTQGGATFPLELMRGPDSAIEPARVPRPSEFASWRKLSIPTAMQE